VAAVAVAVRVGAAVAFVVAVAVAVGVVGVGVVVVAVAVAVGVVGVVVAVAVAVRGWAMNVCIMRRWQRSSHSWSGARWRSFSRSVSWPRAQSGPRYGSRSASALMWISISISGSREGSSKWSRSRSGCD